MKQHQTFTRQPLRMRNGFTLLEVILAVALTAIVVGLIAAAIDFHLRQLTVRRAKIEQAQLARAILRRIADDLRAVIVSRPIDFSSVAALQSLSDLGAAGEAASGEGAGDDGAGDDGAGGSGDTPNVESEQAESTATDDLLDSSSVPTTPGVYGTSYDLQVDISRIPRYEEYAFAGDFAVESSSLLSDVKTVSFFLLGAGATTSIAGAGVDPSMLDTLGMTPDQFNQPGGLARRVVARSVARLANQNGNFASLDNQVELLAPEVAMIEFRYFDGTQWLNEWDTEEAGGIPLAIEIAIVLNPVVDARTQDEINTTTMTSFEPDDYYRLVVHLPPSELLPEEDAATADDGSATGSSE